MKIYLKHFQGSSSESPIDFEVVSRASIAAYDGNLNYKFYEITGMKEVKANVDIVDV